MKKILDYSVQLSLGVAALFSAAMLFTLVQDEAEAQVSRRNPTPAYWQDSTGTNSIGFNNSAGLSVIKGGTVYTGSTTNVYLTNVFALRIVDGVVVGIIVP